MSAAAVAAATAVGPLDAAGASAAVAAPAPAAARQWSRDVQRAVRVAVTGVRTVRSVYSAESERGYAVLNQLCNELLRLHHVRAMPLGELQTLPDVRDAAITKLLRLTLQHTEELHACVTQLEQLAQEASQHADSISALITEPWQHQDTTAVGPGLGAPTAAAYVRRAAAPLAADARDKRSVLALVAAQTRAAHTQFGGSLDVSLSSSADTIRTLNQIISGTQGSGGGGEVKMLPERALSARSQVWLSVWTLSPRLGDPSEAEELLTGVSETLAAAAAY